MNRFFCTLPRAGSLYRWRLKNELSAWSMEQQPALRVKRDQVIEIDVSIYGFAETEPSLQVVALLELDDPETGKKSGMHLPVPLLRCCEHCDGLHQGAQCPITYPEKGSSRS